MTFVDTINGKVASSVVGRWFRLDGSGHRKTRAGSYFCTELRAGLATFFAMAYIIAVNARYVQRFSSSKISSLMLTENQHRRRHGWYMRV